MVLARSGAFVAILAEIMQWAGGLAGIYFTVALVLTIAQEHLGAVAGRAGVMAELYERSIPLVVCLGVVASAAALGQGVGAAMSSGVQNAAGALALWQSLAQFVVDAVILSAGASLAVGFATGVLSSQIGILIGAPGALASTWTRLLLVIVTGALTLMGVRLASLIVGLA